MANRSTADTENPIRTDTVIDVNNNDNIEKTQPQDIYSQSPEILRGFLFYLENIKARSDKTIAEYFLDLRTFFRYVKCSRGLVKVGTPDSEISILDVDAKMLSGITLTDLYGYLHYLTKVRENAPAARSRKVSALHTFYDYICNKMHLVDSDPTLQLEMPSVKRALPKFLTLEQCIELLNAVEGKYQERDYCIITLFINCGMRLSELVGINLPDIQNNTVRILGKGNKERMVYLNHACQEALTDYLQVRDTICKTVNRKEDENALFLSQKGNRLSNRHIQEILEKYMTKIGLNGQGLSPHKLRHTAATMMYQHGNVDIRILQEILGHSNLANTEIYTHVASTQLENAVKSSPTASLHRKKREPLPEAKPAKRKKKSENETSDGNSDDQTQQDPVK